MPAKKPTRGHHTPPPELLPHHRAELDKSGLDATAIAAGGFYSESRPGEVARLVAWKGGAGKLGPCLVIPFHAPDGTPTGYCRVKPDNPREKGGKAFKYESPVGQPNRAYLPNGTRPALADPGTPLLLTEGEKKAACADAHGMPCVGLVGVWGWQAKQPRDPATGRTVGPKRLLPDLAAVAWHGRRVTLVFDSDAATNPKVRLAEWRLARALADAGAVVRVARLSAAADGAKQGLDDYLMANGVEALRGLIAAAGRPRRPPKPASAGTTATGPAASHAPPADDKPARPPSTADLLLAIGSTFDLFHDADGRAYAARGRHTHRVKSTAFRRLLTAEFRRQTGGKVPAGEAMSAAVYAIEAVAVCDGPEGQAHVRLAGHGGRVYLHLADAAGTVIEIDADGWRDCPAPPVRFVRPDGLLALPMPEPGGDVADLRRFVNLTDADFPLYLAWLDMALNPDGPYPVMLNVGEQGSGKSSTGEAAKRLLDPNRLTRRGRAKAEDDLLIAAVRQRVLVFDNMRGLPDWTSDALCRLSTGGGFGKRTLYADEDETTFDAVRPVVLNGITDFADAPDLLDRAVIFRHAKLPAGRRLTEKRLWAAFDAARPKLLGALLDRAAGGMRALPRVDLGDDLPRMADFAVWAVACEAGSGGDGRRFQYAYAVNRRATHELALDVSPVAAAMVSLMADRSEWAGEPTHLLAALAPFAQDAKARDWPKSAAKLTNVLRVLKPDLARARGLEVDPDGHTPDRRRQVTITVARPAGPGQQSSASSASSAVADRPDDADDGDDPRPTAATGEWRYGNDPQEGQA